MGNDKNEQIARGLRRVKAHGQTGERADWTTCNANLLREVVAMAASKHSAIRLGYSRDGGAYAIGVYAGEDYFTDYLRPGEDIDQYLNDLLESFREFQGPETTPRRRKGS